MYATFTNHQFVGYLEDAQIASIIAGTTPSDQQAIAPPSIVLVGPISYFRIGPSIRRGIIEFPIRPVWDDQSIALL